MMFVVSVEMGGRASWTATAMILFPLYAALGFFSIYCIISYYAVAAWNRNRRAIHDLLAGTRIVYRPFGKMSHSRRRSEAGDREMSASTNTDISG
jgi:uncharacterized RDD family membrane protein YckC